MNLLDLFLTEGKKYIQDAMPGGALNREVTPQGLLDATALATAPVPVVGDVAGLAADAKRMYDNPEERTPMNVGLSALGLLPFVPAAGVVRNVGSMGFDPRFDPRVKEQEKLRSLVTDVAESKAVAPQMSITDLVGRPFITSMSDRTGVGLLQSVGDVNLNRPVNLQGGQDFMFNNPGMVWASAKGPSKQLLQEAEIIRQVTGQNPVYLPWRMAPSGGDFASMTGESMLSFAEANMSKANKRKLDSRIKKAIPDWAGVNDPKSIEQFRNAPDAVRKSLKNMMDTEFRDSGGLSIGQARLAVADPKQLQGRDAGVMNVGEIFADLPLSSKSGHVAYPYGVPGQGLGQLKEDLSIFQLMPNVVKARGIPDPMSPRQTDIRALQMKPYAGVITEGLLKQLGY